MGTAMTEEEVVVSVVPIAAVMVVSTDVDEVLVDKVAVAVDDDELATPVVVAAVLAVDVSLNTAIVDVDIELARFVLVDATTSAAKWKL